MKISLAQAQLVIFVLVDSSSVEVIGLDDTFSVQISKNGGAFAAGTGTKAEIGSGWYSYELTAIETDTEGPLALLVTGTGAVQQNLLYEVSGSVLAGPAGSYILTTAEAAAVLRCENDDPAMLELLPQVDAYIRMATGHDWAADATVRQEAKSAARLLLVPWHEDPGGTISESSLSLGLRAALVQLEAIALRYKTFAGRNGVGECWLIGVEVGDQVREVVGLVGVTGDQSSKFETAISVKCHIQQVDTGDLSANWYRAEILSPGELP